MDVKRIELLDFMVHEHTVVTFPTSGVVLVTGENGSGKSSVIEGVSWCLWGKTLRGTNPAPCEVRLFVEIDGKEYGITRTRTAKGRAKLVWTIDGEDQPEHDTATKAQEALDTIIGDYSLWRRTGVFSSADAAHFTLASDGDRKRLLENLLGLEKFDTALKDCRGDLKVSKAGYDAASQEISKIRISSEAALRRLADAVERLATLGDVAQGPADECRLDELREAAKAKNKEIAAAERAKLEAEQAHASVQGEVRTLAGLAAGLEEQNCPTCDRAWDDLDERGKKRAELTDKIDKMREDLQPVPDYGVKELRAELQKIQSEGIDLKTQLINAEKSKGLRTQLQADAAASLDELDELEEELDSHGEVVESGGKELSELQACEKVLGLKGVRAHVLGRALDGVETIANTMLEQLPARGKIMQVTLRAGKVKKTGGVTDAIEILVHHPQNGEQTYAACSGGERRRLDVALLLALMEMTKSAHGHECGTLAFDEVFDSLDKAGTAAMVQVLEEMAVDKVVMVISHSEDLISEISPAQHLHITDGEVKIK